MGPVAAGASSARAARVLGGALCLDPNASSWATAGAGTRAGSVCSAGPGSLPGQSPAWTRSGGRGLVSDLQVWSASLDSAPDVFHLRVRLEETGEMFRVANCCSDMTVRELKEELDLLAGIPFNLQRLQYLDQGVLMDDSTLRFHDVVPGGVVSLCVWHYDGWTELVLAAVEGDPSKLACLRITEDSFYRTTYSEHFEGETWKQWVAQRACMALYITSHRGHAEAIQYLLEHGADCSSKSPLGRTPLHVAVAMGRVDCINLLFQYGAPIRDKDAKGETPIAVARRLNHKQSERRMFLLLWVAKSAAKECDPVLRRALPRAQGERSPEEPR